MIFQLADEYLVLPALYLGLKRKECLKFPDLEVRDFLEAIYELNCQHNQKLKKEALTAVRILNSEGVQPVLLKGIAGLLAGLYKDDGERIIGDIDLMIDQSELVKVVELLIGHGYRCGSVEACAHAFGRAFFTYELTIMTRFC